MELAKTDPAAFMKELAQIDNHGEISAETLTEISAGARVKDILEGEVLFGIIRWPFPPQFPEDLKF